MSTVEQEEELCCEMALSENTVFSNYTSRRKLASQRLYFNHPSNLLLTVIEHGYSSVGFLPAKAIHKSRQKDSDESFQMI